MTVKLLLLVILAILSTGLAHADYKTYNQRHGSIYTWSFRTRPNPALMNKMLTQLQKGYAIRNQTLSGLKRVIPLSVREGQTSLKPVYINGIEYVLINGVYVPVDNN